MVHIVHAHADRPRDVGHVDGFEGALAVRAVAAARIAPVIRLAEVPGHVPVQAVGGPAVADHAVQQPASAHPHDLALLGVQPFVLVVGVEQTATGHDIALVPQQRAPAGFAVTPGAPRLLIVGLDAFRHVVVDDEAHVRFVDAHAEGVGGHHHRHPVGDEVALRPPALVGQHAAVVGDRDRPGFRTASPGRPTQLRHGAVDRLGERFGLLARGAVHDTRILRVRGDVLRHPCGLVLVLQADDVEVQVRPVESGDGHQRVAQAQQRDDVPPHPFGGGGGERGDGGPLRQGCDELADAQVRGTEILPPLGDAVRLVDGDERDRHVCGEPTESFGFQAFGSHIQQPDLSSGGLGQHHALFVRVLRGIDVRGAQARVVQSVHLVAHQRDQRRDDDGDARQQCGGNLVAHGFAGTGRHDAEHVTPGHDRSDQPLLPGAERIVAEVPFERGQRPRCGTARAIHDIRITRDVRITYGLHVARGARHIRVASHTAQV